MERRRALVVAGTMTATLAMAGTAMAVNLGLLGSDSDPVGDLTATEIQPATQRESPVRVVVQDIPVKTGGGASSGYVESGDAPAPAPSDDVGYDDDRYDDSDDHDDGYDDDSDDHGDEDRNDDVDEPDDHDDDD